MLDKKDKVQNDKIACVKTLYEQILKVKDNNNQKSIDKLVRDINSSELYLPESLIRKLRKLYDSFITAHDNNISVDRIILKDVLDTLKENYNA